jgi:hypothetical protein
VLLYIREQKVMTKKKENQMLVFEKISFSHHICPKVKNVVYGEEINSKLERYEAAKKMV